MVLCAWLDVPRVLLLAWGRLVRGQRAELSPSPPEVCSAPFMAHGRLACAALAAVSIAFWASPARAIDLVNLDNTPLKLDVTETSIWAQHFQARPGEHEYDQGYASWLNRLNVAVSWWRFTVGVRLDSSLYANTPVNQPHCPSFWPCLSANDLASYSYIQSDDTTRYRNAIYPAKLWASYNAPGLEITAGDAYVQFGRGLVLSMRKIDELGLDTTVRGGKLQWQSDPFAFTFVAGFANPSRVDEATGRALFLPSAPPVTMGETPPVLLPGTTNAKPLFGSDRLIGFDVQAGRGLPVTLATHAVRFTRCSPVSYVAYDPATHNTDVAGEVYDGLWSTPFGSCNDADVQEWLSSLSTTYGPLLNANEIDMVGQSIEIPSLGGHGKLYLEAAGQRSSHDSYLTNAASTNANPNGNAIYGSLSVDAGPVTNTLEVKSFRNFYAVPGAVDVTRAIEFGNVVYSIPPTTETITQDSELGFFSACVNGGRLRSNVRLSSDFLLYGAVGYYRSQTETLTATCNYAGKTLPGPGTTDAAAITNVWDGLAGFEWFFDDRASHFFASTGVRDDTTGLGEAFYHELHAEYAFTKHLANTPYSLEFTGRHRFRYEYGFNSDNAGFFQPWHEGESYVALKVSPKYIFSQGFEYTSLNGQPPVYFNGSIRYNFRSDSSVVLFVGEQRGGLHCVSGVCRVFPAFEGARMELTVRF
jgi:Family of unknown function (DUF6029)